MEADSIHNTNWLKQRVASVWLDLSWSLYSPFPVGFGEEEELTSGLQESAFFSSPFLQLFWLDLNGLWVNKQATCEASTASGRISASPIWKTDTKNQTGHLHC